MRKIYKDEKVSLLFNCMGKENRILHQINEKTEKLFDFCGTELFLLLLF